jgi:FkbM family methyltransferase
MPMETQTSLLHKALRAIGHHSTLRGTDRLLRAFAHPDRQKPCRFETGFFGLDYTGDLANFVDWWVYFYGAFALNELQIMAALADALRAQGKPVNFFDVGANIGHHTLFMSAHADRVFSFEPFHVVRNEIHRKLTHARAGNVTVFPVALGNTNETAAFTPPTGANQGTGTLGSMLPDNAAAQTIPVQVVRGDDFFAANHLPPVSILKMDVEGFEENALNGLKETLWRDRPPIIMEIQRDNQIDADTRRKSAHLQELLYPDHLLFEIGESRRNYTLKPFHLGKTDEALVLPAEMAGILPGTNLH